MLAINFYFFIFNVILLVSIIFHHISNRPSDKEEALKIRNKYLRIRVQELEALLKKGK